MEEKQKKISEKRIQIVDGVLEKSMLYQNHHIRSSHKMLMKLSIVFL